MFAGNAVTNDIVLAEDAPVKFEVNEVPLVGATIPIVNGSTLAVTLILQDGPASYPDKPKTLVTNNWLDCCKYDLAMYAASYFGICVLINLVGSVPPKYAWNSS